MIMRVYSKTIRTTINGYGRLEKQILFLCQYLNCKIKLIYYDIFRASQQLFKS